MATPFERGQRDQEVLLKEWQELGWSSLQDACRAWGTEALENLALLEGQSLPEGENSAEYYRGILSRLD